MQLVKKFHSRSHSAYKGDAYKNSHYRIGEYLIGIVTGYIIYYSKNKKLKIRKSTKIIAWITSITFLLYHIIFTKYAMWSQKTSALIYQSIWKDFWSLSICWIVFACHTLKSGGFIRCLLSHDFFQPLSKACLGIYLFSVPYMRFSAYNMKSFADFDVWWRTHIYVGDVVFSSILGIISHLVIEVPMGKVISYVLGCGENQKKSVKQCVL